MMGNAFLVSGTIGGNSHTVARSIGWRWAKSDRVNPRSPGKVKHVLHAGEVRPISDWRKACTISRMGDDKAYCTM
jgi:hypothetical protein